MATPKRTGVRKGQANGSAKMNGDSQEPRVGRL